MLESDFVNLTDKALADIEKVIDASGRDLDYATVGSGVLEIELDDGGKIVVNRHAAMQEIWVAARAGGFHFRWDGTVWRDTRDGRELMSVLAELISA